MCAGKSGWRRFQSLMKSRQRASPNSSTMRAWRARWLMPLTFILAAFPKDEDYGRKRKRRNLEGLPGRAWRLPGSGPDLVEHGRIPGGEALHAPRPRRRRIQDLEPAVEEPEDGVFEVQVRRDAGDRDVHHLPGLGGAQLAVVEVAAPDLRREEHQALRLLRLPRLEQPP